MKNKIDFEPVFAKLKNILTPYASKLVVVHDTSDNFYLDTAHIMKNKKSLFFGAVRIMKSYVSYHLMPVYCHPELLEQISPELKKHMQGKSCFNFSEIDPKLFKELETLTKKGFARFKAENHI